MRKPSIFLMAYVEVSRVPAQIVALLCSILLSILYPSNLGGYPILPPDAGIPVAASLTDKYLHYVPTVIQVAAPLVLRDKIGAVQLLYVAIANTIATQATKHLLNDCRIRGTKVGQRPNGGRWNMPSGHSSMASCAVFFVIRRYGLWLGLPLSIILLLSMYARVVLNTHTISAVIAGALIGLLSTLLLTSARRPVKPANAVKGGVAA